MKNEVKTPDQKKQETEARQLEAKKSSQAVERKDEQTKPAVSDPKKN